MRWPELAAILPYDVRTALSAAIAGGCPHACAARSIASDAGEVELTAEHLDAALEALAQARELVLLTARLVREHQDDRPPYPVDERGFVNDNDPDR